MARGLGFEPRLEVPKTPVLPLDDPRTYVIDKMRLPYCTDFPSQYKNKYSSQSAKRRVNSEQVTVKRLTLVSTLIFIYHLPFLRYAPCAILYAI